MHRALKEVEAVGYGGKKHAHTRRDSSKRPIVRGEFSRRQSCALFVAVWRASAKIFTSSSGFRAALSLTGHFIHGIVCPDVRPVWLNDQSKSLRPLL